jgi:hypothetical protein
MLHLLGVLKNPIRSELVHVAYVCQLGGLAVQLAESRQHKVRRVLRRRLARIADSDLPGVCSGPETRDGRMRAVFFFPNGPLACSRNNISTVTMKAWPVSEWYQEIFDSLNGNSIHD